MPAGIRHRLWSCAGALLLAWALLAVPAVAQERILTFDSDITVNTDGTLDVVETITVRAEGQEIRRGIFRDFPTRYKDRFRNTVVVDFDVVDITRNGNPERYVLESMRNGVRIRIGNANVTLPRGEHNYRIRYRTGRQLGFFEDFDELYWNVTGNGWRFTIESAAATVTLPEGAEVVRKAAYTGRMGERGQDYRPVEGPYGPGWQTTRALSPGEGLTIAVAWPKGIVAEPTFDDRLRWFIRDNRATGVALIGTLIVLAYYILAWRRYGRDPEGEPVFPRFEPPAGLSPAACRFIRLMTFDRRAFSAALVNMAVKGYLAIEQRGKYYSLHRLRAYDELDDLANGERRVAKKALEGRAELELELDSDNHAVLREAIASMRGSLETEYAKASFTRNTGFFLTGAGLSLLTVAGTAYEAVGAVSFPGLLLIALLAAALPFVVFHFWGDDIDPTFKVKPFDKLPAMGAQADVMKVGFFIFFMVANAFAALPAQIVANPIMALCIALLGGLNTLFFFLLRRPTRAGRKLMDEIEGFRLYLRTAEEQRLEFLHPPEKTPELFERYLPFAIALDVENEWSDKFAAVLAAASRAPGEDGGYAPRWYRSKRPISLDRVGSIGGRLGGVVAAAARPPGSSSGSGGFSSGGGGFSGGGGGGGGGGGW